MHSYGSYEWVECVLSIERLEIIYTYIDGGRTYDYCRVREQCRYYRDCKCGQRGAYRIAYRLSTRTYIRPINQ